MEHDQEIAGWKAPCGPVDYRAMARAAQQECNALQALLARLEAHPSRNADLELHRRRQVRVLTNMYYEQLGLLRLFVERAGLPPLPARGAWSLPERSRKKRKDPGNSGAPASLFAPEQFVS